LEWERDLPKDTQLAGNRVLSRFQMAFERAHAALKKLHNQW
jgi:hypothetical protein